jgi:hypothetical protein
MSGTVITFGALIVIAGVLWLRSWIEVSIEDQHIVHNCHGLAAEDAAHPLFQIDLVNRLLSWPLNVVD